jgi:hypothetical protein
MKSYLHKIFNKSLNWTLNLCYKKILELGFFNRPYSKMFHHFETYSEYILSFKSQDLI